MEWLTISVQYIWSLFKLWIDTLFVIPFVNWDMLWLLVPVWISWFFSEFYQEKVGTSMGNAITNSVVVLWGSIDCTRQTVRLITEKIITSTGEIIWRFALVGLLFIYGILIIFLGIKGKTIIRKIGRVRTATYIFVIFVPVLYNVMPLSMNHILAGILFFPLFYGIIEILDRIIPDPKAIVEDMHSEEQKQQAPIHSTANYSTNQQQSPVQYPQQQHYQYAHNPQTYSQYTQYYVQKHLQQQQQQPKK
jgi:hypothetical protein